MRQLTYVRKRVLEWREATAKLVKYIGTLVFVPHDREFVSSLATRILELRPGKSPGDAATVVDFRGGYEDYLADHSAELATA
jgi:ATPase subunit of ABC transporter with duplicated ATPase domains